MQNPVTQSPGAVRVLPFAVFLLLTFFQDVGGEEGRYWIYLLKTLLAAGVLCLVYRHIQELSLRFSAGAFAVGIGVFVLWVGMDGHYPSLNELYARYLCPQLQKLGLAQKCDPGSAPSPWNPTLVFGAASPLSIVFLVVRIVGASLLVPVIEEVFWRSFVYRYFVSREFDREQLGRFYPLSFLVTSLLFGLEHREWLAGILCGFAYQGLVVWKKRLGDAIVAHAVTNFLLGLWVVWKGAWQFW